LHEPDFGSGEKGTRKYDSLVLTDAREALTEEATAADYQRRVDALQNADPNDIETVTVVLADGWVGGITPRSNIEAYTPVPYADVESMKEDIQSSPRGDWTRPTGQGKFAWFRDRPSGDDRIVDKDFVVATVRRLKSNPKVNIIEITSTINPARLDAEQSA